MSQFDWQTEDNSVWEAEPPDSAENAPFRWRLWLVLFGLLLVAGGSAILAVQRRVNAVTAQIEAEVVATFELVTEAMETQDDELLTTLLMGNRAVWADTQFGFLRSDGLFGREIFDLPNAGSMTVQTVTLSADLHSAELIAYTPYAFRGDSVMLAQTVTLQRGTDHWLYAPPDEATFWGELRLMENDRLLIIYPARDEVLVRQLFDDLSRLVGVPAATLGHFEPEPPLQIMLTTDPEVLLRQLRRGPDFVELPTPTLLGLPIDQAGYALLLDFYSYRVFELIQMRHIEPHRTHW